MVTKENQRFSLVYEVMNDIVAVIRSLLAKIQIFELFDWLKFFEGNSRCNHLHLPKIIAVIFSSFLEFW
jgi:hypothetical protein